ncbi:MAG: peptide chain release factor 2 [Rickettsiales bacterium]|nr:peptide chain release factor 2 [Rickettsiales bacterium]
MKAEALALQEQIEASQKLLKKYLDWDAAVAELARLNEEAENPDLWNDQQAAQALLKERTRLDNMIGGYNALDEQYQDALTLIELAEEEEDEATLSEAEEQLEKVAERLKKLELESLLSGEADANPCFIEIHPGAGGTESHDWASMLYRMYLRWGNLRGFKTEIIEEQSGEEAGIKSATIKISGQNAYGWAKTESGVHRLVRVSPFDSQSRRHTSFASVWVYPEVDDNIDIEIDESHVRVDTYRASGAGGQHVNKTDSAVRLTHEPSGIVVQCQNSRSQHSNRAEAWKMLRARLYERELRKREEAAAAEAASKTDNSWGNQIRSYVLHPYQMVKDLRTSVETGNTTAVLDGEIDLFLSAALAEKVTSSGKN